MDMDKFIDGEIKQASDCATFYMKQAAEYQARVVKLKALKNMLPETKKEAANA